MEPIKQTGLLIKINPTDYKVGSSPLLSTFLNDSSDWLEWKPSDEIQAKMFVFDTKSCATFSACNVVENTVNFLMVHDKLTILQLEWLNKNGYIVDGKLNLSDRFSAIMSGTTENGNYMQNVWDSFRKVGCIPEKMLPFGGNSTLEYLDKKVITQKMIDLANEFRQLFNFAYEWSDISKGNLIIALKQCPLQVAINGGTHAVELININNRFDSYDPFVIPQDISQINYALKGIVTIKITILKKGMSGDDVKTLQTDLKALGYATGVIDGEFGIVTQKAVKAFQSANNLVSDGIVGAMTRAKIDELKKNSKPSSSIELWIQAIKEMEGAKPERNNIGNLRFVGQKYAVDDNGFCKFDTYEHGYEALKSLIVNACTGKSKVYKPTMTLLEFYETYAPSADNNSPSNYARFVAKKIGCEITTIIKTLI